MTVRRWGAVGMSTDWIIEASVRCGIRKPSPWNWIGSGERLQSTRCCPSHAREADVRALFVLGPERTL